MSRPERVALDLDGTLLSCRERQVAVAVWAARSAGLSIEPKHFWAWKRRGLTTLGALVRLGADDAEARRATALWVRMIESDEWLALDRPLPGARDALALLTRRGLDVVVITARRRRVAVRRQVGRHFGLVGEQVIVVAPALATASKRAALVSTSPRFFVGDTESDASAAIHTGVPFVGVTTGQRSAGVLARAGVTVIRTSALGAVRAMLEHHGRGSRGFEIRGPGTIARRAVPQPGGRPR